jgi:putative heme iron utilization protein
MAEAGFDAAASARAVLAEARHGALATREADGAPFVSLVSVATDTAGAPLLLLSALARHSRAIAADRRAALLVAENGTAADPMAAARLTVSGVLERCEDESARERFLARHPAARGYAGFADFALWRLVPAGGHLVAGFGRIHDLPAAALRADSGA